MIHYQINSYDPNRGPVLPVLRRIAIAAACLFGAWMIYRWTDHLLQQPLLSAAAPLFAFVVIVSLRPSRGHRHQMGGTNSPTRL